MKMLPRSLRWLSLSFTRVDHTGLGALRGLALHTLILRNCALVDLNGLRALSAASLPLQQLDLAHNKIDEASLRELHGLPLQQLFLTYCPNVSARCLEVLLQSGLALHMLDLRHSGARRNAVQAAASRLTANSDYLPTLLDLKIIVN
eukprot:g41912.t1